MDAGVQELISERLDSLKGRGAITDYLIAWRGPSGRLSPNVTVWSGSGADMGQQLEAELQWMLAEIVPAHDITVI